MLRPSNLLAFWKRNELQETMMRLNQYIYAVYLGQIKDPVCKNNVALWFDSFQKSDLWALSSMFLLCIFNVFLFKPLESCGFLS